MISLSVEYIIIFVFSVRRISITNNELFRNGCRSLSTTSSKPKTAIVMINMGGPQNTSQVQDYLLRIMTDRDMIQLPVQRFVFKIILIIRIRIIL